MYNNLCFPQKRYGRTWVRPVCMVVFFMQAEKLKSFIQEVKDYKHVLYELTLKDLKVKYRGSMLGLVWSVLNPLLNMVVMTVVFSTLFRNDIEYFPVYYLSGYLIFTLNQEGSTEAMFSMHYAAPLLRKVYIPKYVFPVSKIITAIINLAFSLIAMFLIMLITRAPFHFTIFLLPVLVVYLSIFTTGLGLLLSALAARFRDVTYLYSVAMMAWSFLTPIFYPLEMLPQVVQFLQNFNPMFHYVNFSRNIILYGTPPSLTLHLFCIGCGLIMLAIGSRVFAKMQDSFIYYV